MSFAGFQSFTFQQYPGLGFCPDESFPARFVLLRGPGSGGILTVSHIDLRAASDSCLYRTEDDSCLVLIPDPTTGVDSSVMLEVEALFSAVEIYDHSDPSYDGMVIDPCRVRTFAWDGFEVNELPTAASRMDSEEANRLLNRLVEVLQLEADWTQLPRHGPTGE